MNPFQILLDAPSGKAKSRIQVAALGSYDGGERYGKFSIEPGDVAAWQAGIRVLPGQRILVDAEHKSERAPRDSRALGWINALELDDAGRVWANCEWTRRGAKAVKDGTYKFLSPAYGEFVDEHGVTHPNVLASVAMTNKPFLGSLPAVTLSAKEGTWRLLDEQPKPKKRKKNKPKKLTASKAEPRTLELPVPARTLEQQANDLGLVVLDQAELRELQQARTDRDSDRFTVAFDAAVRARKVSPGERAGLQRLYTLDATTTLESIAIRAPIMPTEPEGEPSLQFGRDDVDLADFDTGSAARSGYAPDSVLLDAQVRQRLRREHRPLSDYPVALDAIVRETQP